MPNNCRVNRKQCPPRRDAAEKVVVNLLRKSGKKPEHFNEWTGIAAVASAMKSMEEITSERERERDGNGGRGTFNNIWTAEFG